MTLHTITGPDEPADRPAAQPGQSPLSYAIQAIGTLVSESPLAREQFQEARHDQAEADRLDGEAAQIGLRITDAEARAAAERHKADPHQRMNRGLGTGVGILLAVLDALPAYWSAESFGLSQVSTLLVTVLLCAALGGAMWLLDLFSRQHRRAALHILEGTLVAGFPRPVHPPAGLPAGDRRRGSPLLGHRGPRPHGHLGRPGRGGFRGVVPPGTEGGRGSRAHRPADGKIRRRRGRRGRPHQGRQVSGRPGGHSRDVGRVLPAGGH